MKWLHISDIHFNFKNYETSMLRDKLLKFLEKQKDFDFILITGDIFFQYGKDVDEDEIADFIKNIRKACKCDPDKVYICPGNHDVNRKDEDRNKLITDIRKKKLVMNSSEVTKLARLGHEKFKNVYKDITEKKYNSFDVFMCPEKNIE